MYRINNSVVTLIFGDIIQSKADVIVSSDDTEVSMGGGVSGRILQEGGDVIRSDAKKKLPARVGDVIVSTSGALKYQKFVFHALTINHDQKHQIYTGAISNPDDVQDYILQHTVGRCFQLLHALELKSIAFPCIGAGLAHISLSKIAEVMAEAISAHLNKTHKPIEVELYIFDRFGKYTLMDYVELFEKFAINASSSKTPSDQVVSGGRDKYDKPSIMTPFPRRGEMCHDIFVSYSRAETDKDAVLELRRILDEQRLSYWIDVDGVYSGNNYKEVIVDAIDVSKAVIFVSSENSNNSINVIRELGYAVRQNKTIIPVLIDDAPYAKSIRLDLADVDHIDFSMPANAKAKLIASLLYAITRDVHCYKQETSAE